jgi:hypothetical protein
MHHGVAPSTAERRISLRRIFDIQQNSPDVHRDPISKLTTTATTTARETASGSDSLLVLCFAVRFLKALVH